MSELTIAELKTDRAVAELAILELLQKFEEKWGTGAVNRVGIERDISGMTRIWKIKNVSFDVSLI